VLVLRILGPNCTLAVSNAHTGESRWVSQRDGQTDRETDRRQSVILGSCLSPASFNVFMNVFILELRKLNCGCHVNGLFVGCLLYADDIILLSPSVEGYIRAIKLHVVSLYFNASKCRCMAVGKMCNAVIRPLHIGNLQIEWCNCIKYVYM